ncbi:MAG TPA: DUF3160 domain-containing protein [Polyangiaceae bacterium]|nr:DUF3160 domain-containing protein [Polyangiaceae bacterium]
MNGAKAAPWAFSVIVAIGSSGCRPTTVSHGSAPARAFGAPLVQKTGAEDRFARTTFDALRAQAGDLTYEDLVGRLGARRAAEASPRFDPTRVPYYDKVRASLQLTPEEEAIYRRTGLVGVDHGQRYSMGSLYHAIYTRDLPVLVTTDSILHAMHRSFDALLMQLELSEFAPAMADTLRAAHDVLRGEMAAPYDATLAASLADVDLYFTVARNLLAGSGMPDPSPRPAADGNADASLSIPSIAGQDGIVRRVLQKIASAKPDVDFALYGGQRPVDWSQFVPRGHYTKTPELRRYFHAIMWLGRADLGFALQPPAEVTGVHPDTPRESRDAAVLALVLERAGKLASLGAMSHAIDFLVGAGDNVTPADVVSALARAGIKEMAALGDPTATRRMFAELRKAGVGGQRIRSQRLESPPGGTDETPLPEIMQVFGQRFVIDSFVLSKVVFDSIVFKGEKPERFIPSGLDVMASLGSDEATALLKPELEKYRYSANLFAARSLVMQRATDSWHASAYDTWLAALSTLHNVPERGAFPETMRGRAWQHKELETELGSWAELRHDTILYAKQSYTASIMCEYPTGYVEPYPELFAHVAFWAEELRRRLDAANLTPQGAGGFLEGFAATLHKLEKLAQKELASESFSDDEKKFIKETIDVHIVGGGCGGGVRQYSGWYPSLFYRSSPESWEPTIADVHTDPNSGSVLEVAVGDANFLVVAIDNAGDRAAYVGPIYSYYEFTSPERLTDESWQQRIGARQLPERPAWTRSFEAKAVERQLGR